MTDYKFVKAIKNGTEYYSPFCYNGTGRLLTKVIQNNVEYMLPSIHVTSVSLNANSIQFTTAGQTYQLTATINPSNATNKKVTWSSSNTNIATVDANGLVTCVTPGSATITVTTQDGGYTATCTVKKLVPAKIDLLVVGGGGNGGNGNRSGYSSDYYTGYGGGGGGGEVLYCTNLTISVECTTVTVTRYNSIFGDISAGCGGAGGNAYSGCGCVGCSGGGGGGGGGGGTRGQGAGGTSTKGHGSGGAGVYCSSGGGGAMGGSGYGGSAGYGGNGADGYCSDISGTMTWYAGGGAGAGCCGKGAGGLGGGGCGGGWNDCNATYYGGGGGGAYGNNCSTNYGGCGCQGIIIARYPSSCGYNITGGCKYLCNGYCIHCFTSNGTFIIG